jgi:hypothetical protein
LKHIKSNFKTYFKIYIVPFIKRYFRSFIKWYIISFIKWYFISFIKWYIMSFIQGKAWQGKARRTSYAAQRRGKPRKGTARLRQPELRHGTVPLGTAMQGKRRKG